jgi:hypothetical protein
MTKWCVLCGGEYNATVLECADCNVPLVDRRPLRVDDVVAEGEEQLVYDFEDIDTMQRLKVDELFWENGVPHAWDGANLIVRPEDEEQADQLLEDADEGEFLDRDVEQISYELEEWDDTHRERLVNALEGASIEHAWDANGELVVLADDEERVDAIVEVLEEEWDGPELTAADIEAAARADEAAFEAGADGEADGDEAAEGDDVEVPAGELLSDVFVAADRLVHDPADSEGVLGYVNAAEAVERLALPFGFSPAVWKDMQQRILELRESIEGDVDDDVILEQASSVRNQLRAYV